MLRCCATVYLDSDFVQVRVDFQDVTLVIYVGMAHVDVVVLAHFLDFTINIIDLKCLLLAWHVRVMARTGRPITG